MSSSCSGTSIDRWRIVWVSKRNPGSTSFRWAIGRICCPWTTSRGTSPIASTESGKVPRSEEHTSELQSPDHLVCRLLLEKKKNTTKLQSPHHVVSTAHIQTGDRGGGRHAAREPKDPHNADPHQSVHSPHSILPDRQHHT